jgi:hypothetical protein
MGGIFLVSYDIDLTGKRVLFTRGFDVDRFSPALPLRWAPEFSPSTGTGFVPLWPLLVIVVGLEVWLFPRVRHVAAGHCRCGYDLAGVDPGAPCPECGHRAMC